MADRSKRHLANVEGPFFVDTSCIDCDASVQCAPTLFGRVDGQAVVVRQPETDDERIAATRALLICPVGAIGAHGVALETKGLFPQRLEGRVHLCGFNSERSYGANSYFVEDPRGNLLVDSPRFATALVHAFEDMGGVARILLTHRDDVADAHRYAAHFGSEVVIHEADRDAAPYATRVLAGIGEQELAPDLRVIPLPGHTRGSVAFLYEGRALFTGDSLAYSPRRDSLTAFRQQCWYSWSEQAKSLARLATTPFDRIYPGHGHRHVASLEWMHEALERLVTWMQAH